MLSPKKPRIPNQDQSFDDRALHLQKNIYGSDKGKLRLLILQRDLQPIADKAQSLSVLDAGCGMGLMSEWFARRGHHVFACDSSEIMVAETQKRLASYPNSQCEQVCIQSLTDSPSTDKRYDVVMCHAVLEWVADQDELLHTLSKLVKPNGYLSLMFYNAWAREMAQLVYGNFDYIDKNYQVRQRVKLNPHRPAFPDKVKEQLNQQGLSVISRSGIRIFYDIIRNRDHYQQFPEDIIRHELRVSQQYPHWQMGRYVHFLCQRKE